MQRIDTGDSRPGAVPRAITRAAIAGLRPGAIILLHDPHPWTPAVTRKVLRAARKRHLRGNLVDGGKIASKYVIHLFGTA